ncbi:hypothetical protein LG299_06125 [Microbacterium lacus]|uniref:hypothetical protein n=1 Tax=Microbacterium lacus TaxID=415217 RepID=UPI00384B74B0
MDIPLVAGTVATVVFAVSNLPMLRKALRTRDVSSYSYSSLAMINGANVVYSLYVYSLPFGPIWGLHAFYLISCAIMLVLCVSQRAKHRTATPRRHQWGSTRLTPSPIMTTAMMPSSTRHARGVESQRPR